MPNRCRWWEVESIGEPGKEKLLKISPAQIDRLLRPARVQHPKRGLSTTRPGTLPLRQTVPTRGGSPDTTRPGSVEADTVAHCDDSTEGDYVNSLTFTELYSGWTENRAVWNKSAAAVLVQLKELELVVPYEMKNFHTDNGGEFLNWALHRHLTGRPMKLPWTRSRAYPSTTTISPFALTQVFCYRVVAVASVECYPKLEAMNGNCQQVGAEGNLGSGARSV